MIAEGAERPLRVDADVLPFPDHETREVLGLIAADIAHARASGLPAAERAIAMLEACKARRLG